MKYFCRIRASTFMRVSEEIEQIFPNEKQNTYYIPYVASGSKNKKGYGPKGKLWSRYVNVRSALRNASNLKHSTVDCLGNKVSSSTSSQENINKTSDEEHTLIEFLKAATEPHLKIQDAWEQTCKARRRIYMQADLDTIYKDFPCLKLNTGIELVSLNSVVVYLNTYMYMLLF